MKFYFSKFILSFALISCSAGCAFSSPLEVSKSIDEALHSRNPNWYRYTTKFGILQFTKADGEPGLPATDLLLNGKHFFSVKGEKDTQGANIWLMTEPVSGTAVELGQRPTKVLPKDQEVKRLIVLLGGNLTCVKKLIILDFTDDRPFVSERFGYNPADQFCLKFKSAKWGKSQSYIYLDDGDKYVYYTNGKAIGPIE